MTRSANVDRPLDGNMAPRQAASASIRRMAARVAVALVVVFSVMGFTHHAQAQEECRGTKKWYAGQCRYPKDIEALKKKAEAQKAAELRRQQEEAQRRKDAEAAKQAEAKKADEAACELARVANTVAGWKTYLKEHSGGACLDEAIKRITELSGKPPEPQPVEPAQPQPTQPQPTDPAPVAPPPSPDPVQPAPKTGDSGGISPLVWVGFGIAGVGIVLGSITGGISFAQAQDLQDTCNDNVCPADRGGEVDTMLALAHVSTTSFVLAGVGATLGVIGLFLGGSDEEQAALDVHVGPGTLMVTGSF